VRRRFDRPSYRLQAFDESMFRAPARMLSQLDCFVRLWVGVAEVRIRLSQVAFAGGRVLLAVDGLSDEHIIVLSEASAMVLPMMSAMLPILIHPFGAPLQDVARCCVMLFPANPELLCTCLLHGGSSVLKSAGLASLPYGGTGFFAVPRAGCECS